MLYYQCFLDEDETRTLNIVEITLKQTEECNSEEANFREKGCIQFNRFQNPTQIIYDIVDVDIVNMTITTDPSFETPIAYNGRMAVVCQLEFTYTNLLLVYNITLNGTLKRFEEMKLLKYNSASKISWDTFRINRIQAIPQTQFLVASVDNFGAILYHTGTN